MDALKQAGALVLRVDAFDLLVLDRRGKLHMLDCKMKSGRATDNQQKLVDEGWPLAFVRDEESALRCIGAIR